MKLLVIGGGNMGLTYSEGMSQSPLLNRRKLMIQDLSPDTLSRLRQNPDFEVYANLEDCLPKADIVFIAVKPYHCVELFEKMKGMINDQQVFVSRSEEHTSELQSRPHLVCRLLLEKKKKNQI